MNKNYWNRVALTYEEEIFDVFSNNKGMVLQQYLLKHATPNGTAIDFGCGVGKAFRYLSPSFKQVLAFDISKNCVATATQVVKDKGYTNISVKQKDLAVNRLKLPSCNFACCVNVVMLPALDKNRAILKNMFTTLKKGGAAVIVVPSLESKLYTASQLLRWHRKDGTAEKEIPASEFNHISTKPKETAQGLVKIDTEPTKHYLREEIMALFSDIGFSVTAIEKLEYNWTTEFATPPKWMKEPLPWDWLIECRKPA